MRKTQLILLFLFGAMEVMGRQRLTYYGNSMTWAEAQVHCRLHHTDLVTIRNDADNDEIVLDSWLGLYRETSSDDWNWSRGDEPLRYNNKWNNGDPTDGKNCVYKQKGDNGPWRSKDCGESHKFFCVDETLFFVREMKSWEEALAHCRSTKVIDPTVFNNHSYDLASIVTQEDHEVAQEMIQTAETDRVWTGLRFLGDGWMWVGGEEVQYGDIDTCPSIDRCGVLKVNNTDLYGLRKCHEQKNFLCYKRPAV